MSENVTKRIFKACLHRHRGPDRDEVKEGGKPQDKNVGKGYQQGGQILKNTTLLGTQKLDIETRTRGC